MGCYMMKNKKRIVDDGPHGVLHRSGAWNRGGNADPAPASVDSTTSEEGVSCSVPR